MSRYNPNHPVHCSCPQCSWWSLRSGPRSSAECDGSLLFPLQTRIITPDRSPSLHASILMLLCTSLDYFSSESIESACLPRLSRNSVSESARVDGWV